MGAALDLVNKFFDAFGRATSTRRTTVRRHVRVRHADGPDDEARAPMMGMAFKAGLPDGHMEIDHVVDNGDEVFIEGRFVGTHSGDFPTPDGGVDPGDGNKIELRFADYFKASGGKIVEHRTYFDQAGMMAQLTGGA